MPNTNQSTQKKKQKNKTKKKKQVNALSTIKVGGKRAMGLPPIASPAQQRRLAILSECATKYAGSLANPFESGPKDACIPDFPALLTYKQKSYCKGTFSTATSSGFGFCVFDPFNAVVNDQYCGVVSGNGTDLTTIGADGTTPTVFSNANFAAAQFGNTAGLNQGRVVSAGLRIRPITAILYQGGQVVGLMEPNHNDLSGFTLTALDQYLESRRFSVKPDGKWITLLYRPVDVLDANFTSTFNTLSAGNLGFYMAFCVQAPQGTVNLTFEFEFFANHEIIGSKIRGKTLSHYDPSGYGAVHSASIEAPHLLASNTDAVANQSSFINRAMHTLAEGGSWVMNHLGGPLGGAAASLAGQAAKQVPRLLSSLDGASGGTLAAEGILGGMGMLAL